MKIEYKYFLMLLTAITLVSCKSDKSSSSENTSDTLAIINDKLSGKDYQSVLLIPPCDFFIELNELSIKLDPKIVISTDNLRKYDNTRLEALNLGVYLADFTYLLLANETEQSSDYLPGINDLSNKLRLDLSWSKKLFKQIKKNKDNPDSLCEISNDLQERIILDLEFSYRHEIVAMVTIGTFIEAVYLSLSNFSNYGDIDLINNQLNNHRHIFNQYQTYLKQFNDNPRILSTLSELSELKTFFEELKLVSNKRDIVRTDSSMIKISGGAKISLSQEELVELMKIVYSVRKKITLS